MVVCSVLYYVFVKIYTIKRNYNFYRKVFCSGFTILLMRNNDLISAMQSEKAVCHLFTIAFVTVCSYQEQVEKKSHPLALGARPQRLGSLYSVKKGGNFQGTIWNTCIRQQSGFPLQFFESPLDVTFSFTYIGSVKVLRLGNTDFPLLLLHILSGAEGKQL